MNDTRARFEEIWPVPEGVYWCADLGEYMRTDASNKFLLPVCVEYDARLDTFTRCQETTAIHLSLIDELVQSLQWYVDEDEINEDDEGNCYWVAGKHAAQSICDRAKQIMGDKK